MILGGSFWSDFSFSISRWHWLWAYHYCLCVVYEAVFVVLMSLFLVHKCVNRQHKYMLWVLSDVVHTFLHATFIFISNLHCKITSFLHAHSHIPVTSRLLTCQTRDESDLCWGSLKSSRLRKPRVVPARMLPAGFAQVEAPLPHMLAKIQKKSSSLGFCMQTWSI